MYQTVVPVIPSTSSPSAQTYPYRLKCADSHEVRAISNYRRPTHCTSRTWQTHVSLYFEDQQPQIVVTMIYPHFVIHAIRHVYFMPLSAFLPFPVSEYARPVPLYRVLTLSHYHPVVPDVSNQCYPYHFQFTQVLDLVLPKPNRNNASANVIDRARLRDT
ncbi:hypothetical protein BDM02DRAFT_1824942 [Thelephora ganbajun]|uniref:Uncharacterized protein n=1 Tax=Thelephora ganbajun TaxID=370292 RepID=A0ACB6ZIV4_THEGA|nr:hypothetical protein BDM02DRAFT_1824942 [Thelephora ganbajun]